MRLRGDFQYLFIALYLSTTAAAEPIPQIPSDATSPSLLGNDVALSSQTGDGSPSGSLPTEPTFLGGESPAEGTLVAAGLPATKTDFGPPIPQDPTKDPTDFGAYPGYPQPANIPDLYDPKTRQKNGYMDYHEQIRGECPDGEELYCCRWGQHQVLSSQAITSGPIKCILWLDWLPVWRVPQCIPEQQECCAGGVDQFGNGIDCKKAKTTSQKQRQGAGASEGETPKGGDPPGGSNEQGKEPESQAKPLLNVNPPDRTPETSSPWKFEIPTWLQKPDWLQLGS